MSFVKTFCILSEVIQVNYAFQIPPLHCRHNLSNWISPINKKETFPSNYATVFQFFHEQILIAIDSGSEKADVPLEEGLM